tara:strand:+ start:515 stop:973 length:459 start_codon:yes stop_codon:yes gene_type:complete
MKMKDKAIDLRNRKYSDKEFSEKFGMKFLPAKIKSNRRRAIDCTMVESSKINPNYFKYIVTILEKDGKTYKEPAYGRDMQSALSRLIRKEITYKVENKINSTWIALLLVVLIGYPAILTSHSNQPLYLVLSFIAIISLFGGTFVWYKYIDDK